MHIESLKTWHWLVIGAIIGLGIAALRTQTPIAVDSRAGLSLGEFADLAAASYSPARPVLRNLRVYPPVEGRNFVTGEYLRSAGFFSAGQYVPFQLNTPVPFRLPHAPPSPSPASTVRDYLAQVNPSLPYTYAWYASDGAQFTLCIAASILLIGGLWPVVLRLLIGAGFGRKPAPEPAYDLDRFARADETPAAPPAPSAEDTSRLHTLTQTLESQLAAGVTAGAAANPSSSDEPAPAIVALSDAPYEPDAGPDQSGRPKDYKGEFYPVARTQKPDA